MERIVGIDPGLSGAFCIITMHDNGEKEFIFEPMPTIGSELDYHKLAQIFSVLFDTHVFIEQVHSMPRQGVASTFKFGRVCGALEALLHAYKIEHTYVTPQAWQKIMHEGVSRTSLPDPKQRSLAVARRLFPNVDLRKPLKKGPSKFPDDGYVDALLIADYGRRQKLFGKATAEAPKA